MWHIGDSIFPRTNNQYIFLTTVDVSIEGTFLDKEGQGRQGQ